MEENIREILLGGQSFSWTEEEDGYFSAVLNERVYRIKGIEDAVDDSYLHSYFDLDYDYEELLGMTTIGTINDTRLLGITVESTDPEEAMEIANSLADKAVTYVPDVMETATPNIAEDAIVPEHKSSPSLAKNTIIGALILTIVVAGFFVVRLLMDDTFKSAEDVEKAFGVMPLTVIPEGNLEGIDDKAEKKILKEKKKKKAKKSEGAADE